MMSISNETIDAVIDKLNEIAGDYDWECYGLPVGNSKQILLMREAVREVLERPATQHCPQCEAKAKEIKYLNERLKANNNLNAELCTKVVDLQDTIDKQRCIQRARGILRIAELKTALQFYADCKWGFMGVVRSFPEQVPDGVDKSDLGAYARTVLANCVKPEVDHE